MNENTYQKRKCLPCEDKELKVLDKKFVDEYLEGLSKWDLSSDGKSITKTFPFKDFLEGLSFVNKISLIAENEGHHPDIFLSYSYVKIILTTHNLDGLTNNDFIVAQLIEDIR